MISAYINIFKKIIKVVSWWYLRLFSFWYGPWRQYRIDIHSVTMIFKYTSGPVLSKQKVLLKVSKTWVILVPQLLVDLYSQEFSSCTYLHGRSVYCLWVLATNHVIREDVLLIISLKSWVFSGKFRFHFEGI